MIFGKLFFQVIIVWRFFSILFLFNKVFFFFNCLFVYFRQLLSLWTVEKVLWSSSFPCIYSSLSRIIIFFVHPIKVLIYVILISERISQHLKVRRFSSIPKASPGRGTVKVNLVTWNSRKSLSPMNHVLCINTRSSSIVIPWMRRVGVTTFRRFVLMRWIRDT